MVLIWTAFLIVFLRKSRVLKPARNGTNFEFIHFVVLGLIPFYCWSTDFCNR